jgi:hypothetical protein
MRLSLTDFGQYWDDDELAQSTASPKPRRPACAKARRSTRAEASLALYLPTKPFSELHISDGDYEWRKNFIAGVIGWYLI